ncbi:SDR family oxidoreductase [Paenibacillus sp. sgz500958]|uniref:SDR family oxidoreductase n=1 Tax=Paenibacillus sp. sgz500958 TaxID=3242475 RepID=UPI0036D36BB3
MKVLVIGGSRFVGRHIVEKLIEAGIEVTVFNRGVSRSGVFPGTETIIGDRNNAHDLQQLQGRTWDAVVDTCGYFPHSVARTADLLKGQTEHYLFISTCSVYKDWIYKEYIDETSELVALNPEEAKIWLAGQGEESRGRELYGELKVLCEAEIDKRSFPLVTHIRPCVIAGPYDPTDRFTYWVERIAEGGTILAPLPKEGRLQVIDARDLAEWTVQLITNKTAGTFNASGPQSPFTMEEFLQECADALHTSPTFIWKNEEFLSSHNVSPWSDMPFWIPGAKSAISNAKAMQNGLVLRNIRETVRDTHVWASEEWKKRPHAAGLSREREEALISKGEQHDEI